MKLRIMVVFMVILATLVFGMVTATSLCSADGGFVIGGGHLFEPEGDVYGGNVMGMKDGSIRGEWRHADVEVDVMFHGDASFLVCYDDGTYGPGVVAVFGGPGTFNGQPGHLFIAAYADRQEITDAYAITIYRDDDGNGIATATDFIKYEESSCTNVGNVQVHPPTPGHPYWNGPPDGWLPEINRIASTQLPPYP